jgi:endonuclease YncB( thermonuclease family)
MNRDALVIWSASRKARNENFYLFVLLPYLLLLFVPLQSYAQTIIIGRVVGISDGDTITVLQNKTQYKIRLYGIDTPEKSQDFGNKAKQFTSDLVFKKDVKVIQEDTDRYGRIVGTVFVDGICVNEKIVKNGYAWVYRKYCDKPVCKEWMKLEVQARENKAGLWSLPNPIPPWQFRHNENKASQVSTVGAQKAETVGSQTSETVYHGNVESRIFHRAGCQHFNCKNCTKIFNSRDEAVNAGYRACKICRP